MAFHQGIAQTSSARAISRFPPRATDLTARNYANATLSAGGPFPLALSQHQTGRDMRPVSSGHSKCLHQGASATAVPASPSNTDFSDDELTR